MKNQMRVTLLVVTILFFFSTSSICNADEPNDYTIASNQTDFSAALSVDSAITIDASTVDVHNNVYTFSGFDPEISGDLVDDPSEYVLTSSGILLQAMSGQTDFSSYHEELTNLLEVNNISASVRDLSAVSFTFSTDPTVNAISLDFLLASGEYYEGEWDIAGVFIDGENFAYLPGGHLLRVDSEAAVANVCTVGDPWGCELTPYYINELSIGSISKVLTLIASIDSTLSTHTFSASVANTGDFVLPTSLLIANFQTFDISPQEIEAFSFGIQLEPVTEEPVIEVEVVPAPDPLQDSEITRATAIASEIDSTVTILISGIFREVIRNIDVNGRRISSNSWKQDSSTVSVTVPSSVSEIYEVEIWNGSLPRLEKQSIVVNK